MESFLCMY